MDPSSHVGEYTLTDTRMHHIYKHTQAFCQLKSVEGRWKKKNDPCWQQSHIHRWMLCLFTQTLDLTSQIVLYFIQALLLYLASIPVVTHYPPPTYRSFHVTGCWCKVLFKYRASAWGETFHSDIHADRHLFKKWLSSAAAINAAALLWGHVSNRKKRGEWQSMNCVHRCFGCSWL